LLTIFGLCNTPNKTPPHPNASQQKRPPPCETSLRPEQQSFPAALALLFSQRRILNPYPVQVSQLLVQPLDVRVTLPQAQLVVADGL
jgi:hypothetical protein